MVSLLAPRREMYLSPCALPPSTLLLLFFLFSGLLSYVDAHSWIEAVTHVRDNTPFGKIGYARGNGLQSPSSRG